MPVSIHTHGIQKKPHSCGAIITPEPVASFHYLFRRPFLPLNKARMLLLSGYQDDDIGKYITNDGLLYRVSQ